jgi:hypothetical protein
MRKSFFPLKNISLVRHLLFFAAAVLFLLGMVTLLRLNRFPGQTTLYMIYAALMFADGVVMLTCALLIEGRKQVYWFAVFMLGMNIILTIFDDFGLADLLFVLMCAAVLGALFLFRRQFSV